MTTDLEREARWAKRDAQRARSDAYFEAQRVEHRERHIALVETVLPRAQAEAAVDALLAAGVVFARISSGVDD